VNEVLELDACVAKGDGDGSAVTNTIFEFNTAATNPICTIRR
jgi:hypothetical protein